MSWSVWLGLSSAEGARVALLDIDLAGAEAVAAGLGGIALACDVADEARARAALDEAAERLGPARILVNCAGIGPSARIVGRDGPHDLALFRKVVDVNLVGTFNMMRLAAARMQDLPPLEDGERGVVVMTASVAILERGQVLQMVGHIFANSMLNGETIRLDAALRMGPR